MKKYGRVFQYLKDYKGQVLIYFLFIVLSIAFSIISLGMLMPFLDLIFKGEQSGTGSLISATSNPLVKVFKNFLFQQISKGEDGIESKTKALGIICGLIIVSIFFKNLFLYLSNYILNPLKNKIVNRLRSELYNKILQLPIGFFTEKRKGDLISRITNDMGEVESSVVGTLEGWIRDPLTIIINLSALFILSPQLTFFVLLLIPFVGTFIGRISRSLKRHSSEAALHYADSVSVLDETLLGLRVIKAFNIEPLLRKKFFSIDKKLLEAKNKMITRRDLASPMSEFLGVMVFCGILYFGGSLVLKGRIMEASAFITYLALFYNIINPAKSLSTSFSNMQKGTAAIGRIEEVLLTKNTVDDNINGKRLEIFQHSIELRNVSFAYDGVSVLENINLKIEKGKTVALVGSSGAGKSTLADLVPRFHDVTSGELLVDGVNIKEYSLESVRDQISIVTQEPILFNDTIAANIQLGKQSAKLEEIEAAAKVANAYQFITKKERGFDTNIGDRGSKLSGGERQRLTIARAVLKNPPILILDEATSALDTESERLVQDAINNMMQNRTSIVIAHRLSTIRHADEIIVLQKGRIVERGTHQELLEKGGYYYRLVQMQEVK
ncbi:ABC transporter ATP-binding protein/permease [Chitinophagaceae bacterium LB-8]|uniref:ABC transporter ATP-binding protein/permease n=1 Tax=Paraflavisolibacter caeni TaxID=2982496 RepID=A0A9X2XSA1_9BACT|nr:ABC transporter ATP-binding protein [Paraflavisolibacter caeni]MCU7547931.1 ABC transporter ATP-binding protein/permease [Paraflavisolibacter caeni]